MRQSSGLRTGAKPGDIFVPEVQPVFIEAVRDDFSTRTATDRKAMVEELPEQMTLTINMVYPTTLPLATFPAKLLRSLPDLPPELEYRIVGRTLILRDVKANVIVDFLRNVVPTIPELRKTCGALANTTRRRMPPRSAAGDAGAAASSRRGRPTLARAQAAAGGTQAAVGNGAGETQPPASARLPALRGDRRLGNAAARAQYEVGEQLTRSLSVFPYEFVLMLGDNIYGVGAAAGLPEEVRTAL